MLLLDRDLRLRQLNAAAESLFAMSPRHVLGQRLVELFFDSALLEEKLAVTIQSGRGFSDQSLRLTRPGHEPLLLNCIVTPFEPGPGVLQQGGLVLDLSGLNRLRQLDDSTGVLEVEAGALMGAIEQQLAPRGRAMRLVPHRRTVACSTPSRATTSAIATPNPAPRRGSLRHASTRHTTAPTCISRLSTSERPVPSRAGMLYRPSRRSLSTSCSA